MRCSTQKWTVWLVFQIAIVLVSFTFGALTCTAEPWSKGTLTELLDRYDRGMLARNDLIDRLNKYGIDFQITDDTVDELKGIFVQDKQKEQVVEEIRAKVAPVIFTIDDAQVLKDMTGVRVKLAVDNATKEGSPHLATVIYESMYMEVLGVYQYEHPAGGPAIREPIPMKRVYLNRRENYVKPDEIPAKDKSFLSGQRYLPIDPAKSGQYYEMGPGNNAIHEAAFITCCPDVSGPEPRELYDLDQGILVRFVLPYKITGLKQERYAKTDSFLLIESHFYEPSVAVTELTKRQFIEHVTKLEPNGYAIKAAIPKAELDDVVELLVRRVEVANNNKDGTRYAFQGIRALQILGHKKSEKLAADYIENFMEVASKQSNETLGHWYPGRDWMKYYQLPYPLASNIPEYMRSWKLGARESDLINSYGYGGAGSFEEEFGAIFDALVGNNSVVVNELLQRHGDVDGVTSDDSLRLGLPATISILSISMREKKNYLPSLKAFLARTPDKCSTTTCPLILYTTQVVKKLDGN